MKLFRIPKAPKAYLDIVKLLAIVLVVFNHSGRNGYTMYMDVQAEPASTLIMFFSAFVKIAVPLFFMASGALLLRKEEPYGTVLVKRALRFALILLAISFFFYYDANAKNGTISVQDFLIHLYKNDIYGHLWYLYSYVCYMLMLPLLRKLAKLMKAQDYLLLIVAYQVMQLLPAADYALFRGTAVHTSYIKIFAAENYVVYPLLGYFIDSRTEEDEREETFFVLLFLSILALAGNCMLLHWRYDLEGAWTSANKEAYMGSLSLLPAITVFYGLKRLFAKHPVKEKTAKVLFVLGSCTFGVYLFDPKWRLFTQSVRLALKPVIGLYAATHVQTICACLLGLAATFLFKCVTGGLGLIVRGIAEDHKLEKSL